MPLPKTQLLILGYGYARRFTNRPAFSLRDLKNECVEDGYNVDISNLYTPAGQLAVCGYIRQHEGQSHITAPPPSPTGPMQQVTVIESRGDSKTSGSARSRKPNSGKHYMFQDPGFEPLIGGVMQGIRTLGKTLPEILRLTVSVEALIDYADFFGLLQTDLLEPSNTSTLERVT